jgi:streptogramin lyase
MNSEKRLNKKRIIVWQRILLLLFTINFSLFSFSQIGTWKTYLSYYGVQQIEAAGSDIFVLSSNSLWSYNKNDQSILTYDNNNGLNDINITTIAWNKTAKRLLIAYDNCNIDLLDLKGNVINIPGINLKIITGKKTINSTYINGKYCYLACSFGIVKVDMANSEISESYMLGFEVNKVTINGNSIYALSADDAIWSCSIDKNLIDKGNWSINTTIDSSIFNTDDTDYQQYYPIVSTLNPDSPKYNYFRFLRFRNNKLYTCNGIMEGAFGGVFDPGKTATIQVWDGNNWNIYQDELNSITGHNYVDLASLDVDPNDPNHVFAGGRIGLYEFRNGKFIQEYNYDNSDLVSNVTLDHLSKNYTMVETVVYDKKGNLWLFNSSSDSTSLFEITKEGEWISHHKKEFMISDGRSFDNVVRATFDSNGLLWLCNNRFIEPALLCYNPSTDEAIAYKSFINQDGTPLASVISGVTSVAEDLDGNIWFGTDAGPMMIEKQYIGKDPSDMVFTQVKVPRNDGTNYADYLLAGIYISCIKVDNDGKKWFGTNGNGVYVISKDNMTEVEHFTTENSGLISNNIGDIEINENTGEVFIGTDNGLCSYMSGITKVIDEMTKDEVYAYPNPVKPDYTGLITITGLTYNADVKILSSNGALIKEGKSNGRMFTWDGNDKNGHRVASGIYMVATATNDGKQGVVCKIAIIN